MVRLFEFTGPYHAPIIIEVFGKWVIQNADWWGAFGICSLVLDSMRLWVKAAPVPFPGARLISLLYSRESKMLREGQMLPQRVAFQRTKLGPLQIASMRPLPETICNGLFHNWCALARPSPNCGGRSANYCYWEYPCITFCGRLNVLRTS